MSVASWPVMNSGTVYKNGKLYLFSKGRGDGGVVQVIRADPENPAAWIKKVSIDGQFKGWRPEIDLSTIDFSSKDQVLSNEPVHHISSTLDMIKAFNCQDAARKKQEFVVGGMSSQVPEKPSHRAWRLAFTAVPETVRALAAQFSRRSQWNVLTSCLRVPGLQDLDNMGLLFLHSHIHLGRQPRLTKPMRSLRRLIVRPRKVQISFYGLPECEQAVNILGKIPTDSLYRGTILPFCKVLREGDRSLFSTLSHLPVVNMGVMQLLCDHSLLKAAFPSFLNDVSVGLQGYRDCCWMLSNLKDCLTMAEQLSRPAFKVRSMADLESLHDELVAELNLVSKFNVTIPLPPHAGVADFIRPLVSAAEIYEYGKEQGNCIASYIPAVSDGKCYLYAYRLNRTDMLEEGTLALVNTEGRWQLGEIRARFNSIPSSAAYHQIARWLYSENRDVYISSNAANLNGGPRVAEPANAEIELASMEEFVAQLELPF